MKICISTLFFYKNELCLEFLRHLTPGLKSFSQGFPKDSIHLVVTNNAPANRLGEEFAREFERLKNEVPDAVITVQHNEWNKGFGAAHNECFASHPSDVFVGLNNDLFFSDDSWLEKLIAPLRESFADAVGLLNAPRILKPDGNGAYADSEANESDYAEGSAFAVKSDLIRKIGLFAEDIRVAYCEDSDFSLRMRQAGYQIQFVNIAHEHRRSSSTKIIPHTTLEAIHERNRSRLLSRWGQYLQKKKLTNRIYLELVSDGWGDVFCALPSVLQLRDDHPTAQIRVRVKQDFLQCIFENISDLSVEIGGNLRCEEFEVIESESDRIFRLQNIAFTETQLLGREIASAMGVEFAPEKAERHLNKLLEEWPSDHLRLNSEQIAIVHADYARPDWEGRGPTPSLFFDAINELKKRGYSTIAIGGATANEGIKELANRCDLNLLGKTDFRTMLQLIARAHLFLGIDSGPLHIAQHIGTKTFAVFGATLPTARLFRWDNTDVFMNWNLACLGCYHQVFKPNAYNFCIRRDEACVKKCSATELSHSLIKFLDNGQTNLPKALTLLQQTQAVKREFQLRTGLAMPQNQVELDRLRAELNSPGYQTFRKIITFAKAFLPFKGTAKAIFRGLNSAQKTVRSVLQPKTTV